jgi:hypothetical protein
MTCSTFLQGGNQLPLTYTQPQHMEKKKDITTTMVPPGRWLPAAPILKVSEIAQWSVVAHYHQKTAMYFLLMKLTYS